jgi:predicted kinase
MEAVIFVGIQASGKSTYYLQHFYHSHIRLNMDMLRTRHREAILLRACLDAKQPFVLDNTNPTVDDRAVYIEAAKGARFRVTGYFFQTTVADALARNAIRVGKANIPDKAIFATQQRLERPTLNEGFDALYTITLEASGEFKTDELR